jgi:exonuclease VII small subunit
MDEDADADGNGTDPETEKGPDEPVVDPEDVDERIRRVEAIVRALESGDVAPEERAARIAEGKELVEGLERDLETLGDEGESGDGESGDGADEE